MRFSSITAFMVRAVRQDSRSIPSLLMRTGVVGFLCWQLLMTVDTLRWQTAPGLRMFEALMGFNLFVLFTAGVAYLAASIAEEKEENTLGLLLLSGMGTLPVLLGKTTGRLLAFAMLLLLQIPFTLLCVTMGGMRGGQVFAGYAMLGSLMVLVSGFSVLASVLLRTVRGAVVLSGLALLLWHIVPPFLAEVGADLTLFPAAVCDALQAGGRWMTGVMFYSRMNAITSLAGTTEVFTRAEAFNAGAGVVLLILAALAFMLTESAQSAESAPKTKLGAAFSAGWARWFRPRRRPPVGPAAIRWKDSWLLMGGRMGLFIRLATLTGLALWIYSEIVVDRPAWRSHYMQEYCLSLLFISAGYAALSMFAMASRTFSTEFRDMTMADLLGMPGGAGAVVRQKTLCTLAKALPFLPFMIPGVLVALGEVGKTSFSGEDFLIASNVIVFCLLQILLQLEFVAHLSLKLPRMAAAVSLPGHWIALMMGGGLMFGMFRGGVDTAIAVFFLGSIVSGFLIVLLHVSLPARLHNTLK
ncbi:MAG: hypothetical protein U1G05_00580 [Kiritimatiellia bacterium]